MLKESKYKKYKIFLFFNICKISWDKIEIQK